MSITIKDVAKLANVSVGTVSMAVNGKEGVSEEARQKVFAAVEKLNYRPNHYARSLITNKSATIGLIVTDITNPFFGLIVSRIQRELEREGYNLLLGISNDKLSSEKKHVENFISRNVEGVIIVPSHEKERDLSHLYNLKRFGIPFVSITTTYRGIQSDCVMTDLSKGTYELAKHLIENGAKKIFFIAGYRDLILSSLRIDGYKKAYNESGLDYSEDWIFETYPDYQNGYDTTSRIIQNTTPDAIIAVNDVVAMGVLKCLMDKEIAVPGEVSVAGYDDLIYSSMVWTPLTTIRQPVEDICRKSIKILMDRINGETYTEKIIYLEPELIIRESTKKAR